MPSRIKFKRSKALYTAGRLVKWFENLVIFHGDPITKKKNTHIYVYKENNGGSKVSKTVKLAIKEGSILTLYSAKNIFLRKR